MAQYFPYIQETMPEPVLYTPDFNFFNSVLQKKTAQYEQGVSQAASAYNSVANAPLSNINNVQIRNQYIKDAKEQLKKISSTDLSLPQNIQAAQSIFAPFWEDKFMLKDANDTQWYSGQNQKVTGWRDSTDAKVRAMYSPIQEQYLNNGLMTLQQAPRTDDAFSKVERREAVPFTNMTEWLQEMAKQNADGEGGLKIVYDETTPDGAYLISTTNGLRSQKKFSSWAQSMMSNNFDQQFKITGIVQSENLDKYLRSQNPNINPIELSQAKANYVIDDLIKGYTQRIGGVNGSITEIHNLLKAYPKNPTDPKQIEAATQLLKQRDELTNLRESIQSEYNGFDKDVDKKKTDLVKRVMEDPSGYFSTLAKQQTINSWSTGRSEIESRKIIKNETFFAAQDQALKVQKQNLDQKQYELDVKKQNDLQDYRTKALSGKSGKGTSKVIGMDQEGNPILGFTGLEGEDKSTGGKYLGLGTTNITTDKNTAYDVFIRDQSNLYNTAHGKLFEPTNGVIAILKNAGLNDDDVMQISSGLKRQLTDGSAFAWNDKEKGALKKLTEDGGFKAFYKSDKVKDLEQSIMDYTKNFIKLKKDNNIDYSSNEMAIFQNYREADFDLKKYLANERDKDALIKNNILSNPKQYSKLIVNKNGKDDLIDASYLANNEFKNLGGKLQLKLDVPLAPGMGAISAIGLVGRTALIPAKDLTAKKLADAYMNGELKINYTSSQYSPGAQRAGGGPDAATIDYNDKTYSVPKDLVPVVSGILNKYGSAEDFSSTYKKATTEVVPNLLYYKNRTAQVGAVYQYDAEDVKNDPQSFAIFQEALQPGNQLNMYTIGSDGKKEVIDDMDTRNAIGMLLNSTGNISKYTGGFRYNTQNEKGNQTIEFNVKEIKTADKDAIGGVNLTSLNGTKIDIEISPEAMGPNIGNLPKNSGNYIYAPLLQGETISSDDFMDGFGIHYDVVPNNNTNPTGGSIVIKYPLRTNYLNSQGKLETKVETLTTEPEKFYFTGDSRVTPDEVMDNINNKITQLIFNNQEALKQYNSAIKASGGSAAGQSFDLSGELNKRGIK